MPDRTGPDREDVKPDSSIREAGPSIIGRIGWQICRTLIAVLVVLPATATASDTQEDTEWTVVTVARNGSWGVATARTQGEAIAVSTRKCEAMSAEQSDCGAEFVAFRTGWALALLCGGYRVIVAEMDLEDAERAARARTADLRQSYAPDLPRCSRLLTIDPSGILTTFKAKQLQDADAKHPVER